MRKLLSLLAATALLYSCGGSGENNENGSNPAPTTDTATTAPAASSGTPEVANQKGLELIGANDCMTCHAIDKKVIGPAYVDVAKKYDNTEAVVDTLVAKIKHGGKGNWGEIAMTPHPDLPDADAKEMVKYILSLKNQ
jgi:cytochrome c